MSGTSCDGIDAALVGITRARGRRGPRPDARHALRRPIPRAFRARLLAAAGRRPARARARSTSSSGDASRPRPARSSRGHASSARDVAFVASHGHTARAPLATRGRANGDARAPRSRSGSRRRSPSGTGHRVVADFRPRDVAAGGEGAPLVPFADRLLLAQARARRRVPELGGIANVTALGPGRERPRRVRHGPGQHGDRRRRRARDRRAAALRSRRAHRGARARRRGAARSTCSRIPYFRRRPPKSTGREEFGRRFVGAPARRAPDSARPARPGRDADRVHRALDRRRVCSGSCRRWTSASSAAGGARNATLMRRLAEAMPTVEVVTSAARGVDPDFKEAIAFALLGWAHARGRREHAAGRDRGASGASSRARVWPAGPRAPRGARRPD